MRSQLFRRVLQSASLLAVLAFSAGCIPFATTGVRSLGTTGWDTELTSQTEIGVSVPVPLMIDGMPFFGSGIGGAVDYGPGPHGGPAAPYRPFRNVLYVSGDFYYSYADAGTDYTYYSQELAMMEYGMSIGYGAVTGGFGDIDALWMGVAAGPSVISARLEEEDWSYNVNTSIGSTVGFHATATIFSPVWGGLQLRTLAAPDVEFDDGPHSMSSVSINYYWGWLPALVAWEVASEAHWH